MARTVQTSKVVLRGEETASRVFRQAGREVDTLQKRFTGLSLGAAGLGAAVTAAAAGVAIATKRAVESADATAKQADAIGISTGAFQEYKFAAELSGVANDKFSVGLTQLTKRIGEARAGTGTLVEFLKKYDTNLLTAIQSTQDADSAVDLIFQSLGDTTNQFDRAALAAAAFGRSGVIMTNIVRDGAGAVAAMRQEARDLGLVLDESMLRQAERANDALTRMQRTIQAQLQRALLQFAPLIERIGTAFGNAIPEIVETTEAVAEFFGLVDEKAVGSLEEWREQTRLLAADQGAVGDAIIAIGDTIRGVIGDGGSVDQDLHHARDQVDKFRELMRAEALSGLPAPTIAGEGERPTILNSAAEEEQATKIAAANARLMQTLQEQRLRAAQDEEALAFLRTQRRLQEIADSQLTEIERREAEKLAIETFNLEIENLNRQHRERQAAEEDAARQQQMTATERQAETLKALWQSGLQGQLQITGQVFGQMAALMQTGNEKMFKIGKAFAIAETVINTHEAAVKAYQALAGIPIVGPALGAAAAAAALAYGFARVKSIASSRPGGGTSTGGGGGGSISVSTGGGGGLPAVAEPGSVPDFGGGPAPARDRRITIDVGTRPIWTRDMVIDLLAAVQEALDDGTVLRISET